MSLVMHIKCEKRCSRLRFFLDTYFSDIYIFVSCSETRCSIDVNARENRQMATKKAAAKKPAKKTAKKASKK